MKPKSKILIIAGSDSSGGAGIQADIKTITSLGSYAMTAITAITSQNTNGVHSIFNVSPTEIAKQIEFTSKDIKPDAIKIGMLHSAEVINVVIKSLDKIKVKKIIRSYFPYLLRRFHEDRILYYSGYLSYVTLLSMVPLLAVIFSLF